jgi:hypothetical protein
MSATDQDQPDYSLLTPEEIEAMQAEPSPEELVTMRQSKEAENLDDDDDDVQDSDDDPKDDKPDETKDESTAKTEETSADPQQDQDPKPTEVDETPAKQTTVYDASLPDDYNDQVQKLKDDRAALKAAYKNGDIDFDEYEEQRDTLNDQEKTLDRIALKAEMSQDMNRQSHQKTWESTVQSFVDVTAKADGIDYRKDADKQADLDMFIKALAAKPDNANKPMDWFLKEAHAKVKALHGIETKPATAPNKQGKQDRKTPTEAVPKTLANVIGGDDATEIDGKYAELDKLDGLELETALARMTPEQRNDYLRGV